MKKILIFLLLFSIFIIGCSYQEVIPIAGTVVDSNDDPLEDVDVKSGHQKTQTDAYGEFSLSGKVVAAGEIYLHFSKNGYKSKNERINIISISEGESSKLGPEQNNIVVVMESNN